MKDWAYNIYVDIYNKWIELGMRKDIAIFKTLHFIAKGLVGMAGIGGAALVGDLEDDAAYIKKLERELEEWLKPERNTPDV